MDVFFCQLYRYILFRKKWGAKGFGMTLKIKDLDFQTGNFCSGSPESFEVFYGTSIKYLLVLAHHKFQVRMCILKFSLSLIQISTYETVQVLPTMEMSTTLKILRHL